MATFKCELSGDMKSACFEQARSTSRDDPTSRPQCGRQRGPVRWDSNDRNVSMFPLRVRCTQATAPGPNRHAPSRAAPRPERTARYASIPSTIFWPAQNPEIPSKIANATLNLTPRCKNDSCVAIHASTQSLVLRQHAPRNILRLGSEILISDRGTAVHNGDIGDRVPTIL